MSTSHRIAIATGIAWLAVVSGPRMVHGQTRSRIVNECTNKANCLPQAMSVLVVLVVDAEGVPIAGVPVEIIHPDTSARVSSTKATWLTDLNGAAVVGLTDGERYRLKIDMPGYFAFESDVRVALGTTMNLVNIQLRVPPIQ